MEELNTPVTICCLLIEKKKKEKLPLTGSVLLLAVLYFLICIHDLNGHCASELYVLHGQHADV